MDKNLMISKVLETFLKSLLISMAGAFIAMRFFNPATGLACSIIALVILVGIFIFRACSDNDKLSSGKPKSIWLTYVFTLLMGLGVGPVIKNYLNTLGASIVLICFLATILIFAVLYIYAKTTTKDLSFMKSYLLIALLVLIGFSILNIFIGIKFLAVVIAVAGILIFSGYIIHDVYTIYNEPFKEEDIPLIVIDLYLDFLNLFLYILKLVGLLKD